MAPWGPLSSCPATTCACARAQAVAVCISQAERGVADWNPELDEEFEDRQGNVMNRKTYTDLARQGLLD